MKKFYGLMVVILLSTFANLKAQPIYPFYSNPVKIYLDESGKVKNISGFGLIKREKYDIDVFYDAPLKAHQKFIEDLGKKFIAAHEILTDEYRNPLLPLYSELWGNSFDTIKNDLAELGTLLVGKKPDSVLATKTAGAFRYLGGRDFLLENLFGKKIFIATSGKYTEMGSYKDSLKIKLENIKPDDGELIIKVTRADFYKQFIQAFFSNLESSNDLLFSTIKPKAFYEDSVKAKIQLANLIDSFSRKIDKGEFYVCEDDLQIYDSLQQAMNQNIFVRILKSHWMKSWIWYTNGTLPVNPLAYTEERLVPLQNGHDTALTIEYDAYRIAALQQMLHSDTLNDAKINYAAFDALQKQKGTGEKVFSFTEANEKRRKENIEKAEAQQKVFLTTTSIRLEIIEDKDKIIYRPFDASKKLKDSGTDPLFTVTTDTRVKIVVYNLKNGEDFTKKEIAVDIPDQSKATNAINEVADMAVLLSGNVTGIPGKLITILNQVRDLSQTPAEIKYGIMPYPIAPLSQVDKSLNIKEKIQSPDIKFRFKSEHSNPILIKNNKTGKIYFDGAKKIENYLNRNKLNCKFFTKTVVAEVKTNFGTIDTSLKTAEINSFFETIELRFGNLLDSVIAHALLRFSERETKNVLKKLNLLKALLFLNDNAASYTLPPIALKATTDTTPQFRNRIDSFGRETKAKEKNTEIALINKKTGETIVMVKDSYKTAPSHWILPSIGIGYLANSFRRSGATITNGEISTTADEERIRLFAGFHIYPIPMIKADDRFIKDLKGKALLSRLSIFLGLSFPKPLYNIHGGLGVDLWTGVKLTGGVHLFRYTNYRILNNTIVDEDSRYEYNGAFVSLQIDPVSLVKLFGIIK